MKILSEIANEIIDKPAVFIILLLTAVLHWFYPADIRWIVTTVGLTFAVGIIVGQEMEKRR